MPDRARPHVTSAHVAIELLVFAIILGGVSQFVQTVGPEVSARMPWAGTACGTLTFVFGILYLMGFAPHRWAILIQGVTSILLLAELILAWRRAEGSRVGVVLLAILLTFSLALITMLLSALRNRAANYEPSAPRSEDPLH